MLGVIMRIELLSWSCLFNMHRIMTEFMIYGLLDVNIYLYILIFSPSVLGEIQIHLTIYNNSFKYYIIKI